MTDTAKLSRHLLGSRLNLRRLCEDSGIDYIEPDNLSIIQCINCAIWVEKRKSPDNELCSFCYDLDTLRF